MLQLQTVQYRNSYVHLRITYGLIVYGGKMNEIKIGEIMNNSIERMNPLNI